MFTEMLANRAGVDVPSGWSEVERLVKQLYDFARFRADYRVVWKRKTFMFDRDTPDFGMAVYRRADTVRGPAHQLPSHSINSAKPTLEFVAECFEPEHACSVLRMLIANEEDRETNNERQTRLTLAKIGDYFDSPKARS